MRAEGTIFSVDDSDRELYHEVYPATAHTAASDWRESDQIDLSFDFGWN